jgi:hypothetical protein
MLKEISVKKTELSLKDMVTAVAIGVGAFVGTVLVKKFFSRADPPIIISDGSLSVYSGNDWNSPSNHVHALRPKGPWLHPNAPVGTVEFVYDGTTVDLTPGAGEALDVTILYGASEPTSDTIHVATNPAHHNLRISADAGLFDGSFFSRELDEEGHILSVSAPGKGPYVPTTPGSELDIYFT